MHVYALTDAGTLFRPAAEVRRLRQCRACLKEGDPVLAAAIEQYFVNAVQATPALAEIDLWSWYPGASGSDRMQRFAALASFGRAEHGAVLVRHSPARPRHLCNRARCDPSGQLRTVHLHPHVVVRDRTVAVVDDYLTYGVSFGAAAALLLHAGARAVHCLAMGKYGRSAQRYDIVVRSDPYRPLQRFSCHGSRPMQGTYVPAAQQAFHDFLVDYA